MKRVLLYLLLLIIHSGMFAQTQPNLKVPAMPDQQARMTNLQHEWEAIH